MKSVLSKFDIRNIPFYGIFLVMLLWDVIECYYPNTQFIYLGIFLLIDVIIKKRIKISKWLIIIDIFVAIHGLINIALGNDTLWLLVKQIGAISLSLVVYSNIIDGHSLKEVFMGYWHTAFIMTCVGLIEIFMSVFFPDVIILPAPYLANYVYVSKMIWKIPRLSGLCAEPSFLAYFLAPGVCAYLVSLFNKDCAPNDLFKGKHIRCICMTIVFLLTFSSTAVVGVVVMFGLITLKLKSKLKKILIVATAIAFVLFAYINVGKFRYNVDGVIGAFTGGDTTHVSASSYTLYKNAKVAQKNFVYTYGLGGGLGSHAIAYDRFDSDFKNDPATLAMYKNGYSSDLMYCRDDANSIFLRLTSEMGIFGVVGIFYYLIKYYNKGQNTNVVYSSACLAVFSMLLLRMGNYMHAGQLIFFYMYIRAYLDSNPSKKYPYIVIGKDN